MFEVWRDLSHPYIANFTTECISERSLKIGKYLFAAYGA